MSKTLYALSIPLAAYQFKKGDVDGFIVEIASTNCFVEESAFHKHFHPANSPAPTQTPEPIAAPALPDGLDPLYWKARKSGRFA